MGDGFSLTTIEPFGHTHAFDPPVRLMRDIIAGGELGKLGLIHSLNYTNYLYRPRRPEERR